VDGHAIGQQHDPEHPVASFGDDTPATDAAVALDLLCDWRFDDPPDLFVADQRGLGASERRRSRRSSSITKPGLELRAQCIGQVRIGDAAGLDEELAEEHGKVAEGRRQVCRKGLAL